MDTKFGSIINLISVIVIIIGLIFMIQYKTIDINARDMYEINLSIYQSDLNDHNIKLDKYYEKIDFHNSQIRALDGNQTKGEASVLNINGKILMNIGKSLQNESKCLAIQYDQINREKGNINSRSIISMIQSHFNES
jgi:hypothetical protein